MAMDPWPLDKLSALLHARTVLGQLPPKLGFAVVLTTGAMNPPHRGHVQMLHQARARLEAEGYGVVGAWISPSHDGYVQPKAKRLGTIGLSSRFRLEIARRAVSGDDFVALGAWEADRPGAWPDFPEVAAALQSKLEKSAQASALRVDNPEDEEMNGLIQVFYACGSDHAQNCGLYRGLRPDKGIGVVVVPRTGDRVQGELPGNMVFVASPCSGDWAQLSSTKLREALERRDRGCAVAALGPEAARFLLEPSAEELKAFSDDFAKLGLLDA
ncbi:unnamed protein product [Polarella glacialis]|uniref:Cytidyltransferase-like domain-containing protein n=1 Tax=Polarella glacialis TaxID=89957 RepID=A0A813KAC6_POLGL|nr:unnamed protein product [Polarella glacialis]